VGSVGVAVGSGGRVGRLGSGTVGVGGGVDPDALGDGPPPDALGLGLGPGDGLPVLG